MLSTVGGKPNKEGVMVPQIAENFELVSEKKTVALLKEACDLKLRIKLYRTADETPAYSNLLGINESHLILAGLQPKELEESFVQPCSIEADFKMADKGAFSFNTTVQGVRVGKEYQFYTDWPSSLRVYQRRKYFRAHPTQELPATCVSISKRNTVGRVRVENISLDGALLTFSSTADISVGKILKNIRLRLASEGELNADGIVRLVMPGEKGGCCLGIQFDVLDRETHKRLTAYIIKCQKQMIRRKVDV